MLRLAFDFIITWRETRTRPNAYSKTVPHTEVTKMCMPSSATGIIVYITQYVLPIW